MSVSRHGENMMLINSVRQIQSEQVALQINYSPIWTSRCKHDHNNKNNHLN